VRDEGAAAVARRFAYGEPEAVHALRLFTSIFGAVAGDHALCVLAMGGVFIAGGIAPRFTTVFADGSFIAAFRTKGAHAPLMARMPVHLVCDDRLGLRGAALRALR
jgi:glucokinase